MLKLNAGPSWLDILPGVRVLMDPVSPATLLVAREAARTIIADGGEDARAMATVTFTGTIVRRGLRDWTGVTDAKGKAVTPTPDMVDALLLNHAAYQALDRLYVGPVLEAEAEKNVSSPSRTGSSATAKATAGAAGKTARPPAKPVPSNPTARKPTKASLPGK